MTLRSAQFLVAIVACWRSEFTRSNCATNSHSPTDRLIIETVHLLKRAATEFVKRESSWPAFSFVPRIHIAPPSSRNWTPPGYL